MPIRLLFCISPTKLIHVHVSGGDGVMNAVVMAATIHVCGVLLKRNGNKMYVGNFEERS